MTEQTYGSWRLGLSMAASWSWGASAAVGIGILLTRGHGAFWAWTVANVAAVPAFGVVYRRWPALRPLVDARAVAVPMVAIQVFAYWMNMQAAFEAATGGIDIETVAIAAETPAAVGVVAVAVGLSLFIYRAGLPGSIATDVGQFAVQVGACAAIVAAAVALGVPMRTVPATGTGEVPWVVWAALGLLAGPFLDAQQWQRMERARSSRPAWWAGAWFGGYMVAVGAAGLVLSRATPLLSALFLAVVVAIATSTIDSAAAALQRLSSRRWALAIGVAAAVAWPAVRPLGVVDLWTVYASGRVVVVAGLLAYAATLSRHDDQIHRVRNIQWENVGKR